jgi:hypothetical protein
VTWCILSVLCFIVPAVIVWDFWHEHTRQDWDWITQYGRDMYADVMKTLITASGVAVALIVTALSGHNSSVTHSARLAVVTLTVSIVASMMTTFLLCRFYEKANSRARDVAGKSGMSPENPRWPSDQGQLKPHELALILFPAYFALAGFLLGFLSLTKMAFEL